MPGSVWTAALAEAALERAGLTRDPVEQVYRLGRACVVTFEAIRDNPARAGEYALDLLSVQRRTGEREAVE